MDAFKLKTQQIKAKKLDCDVKITRKNGSFFYVFAGDYLIEGPDGQVYPADKRLFEFLFEREEQQ